MSIPKANRIPLLTTAKTILMILLITGFYQYGCADNSPRVIDGRMDLGNWDPQTHGILKLSGKWQFYWEEHVSPEKISSGHNRPGDGFMDVPGSWNGHMVNGKRIPGKGYATYRLTVQLNGNEAPLALKILDMATAYNMYVNGRPIAWAGQPGKTPDTTIPSYGPKTAVFTPGEKQLDIVVHVSNFHHRLGGMWETILLGTEDQIRGLKNRMDRSFYFSFGVILIMGIYHLVLYFLHLRDKSTIFFGTFCLLIALRILSTGERNIFFFFPGLDFEPLVKIIYISFYLCVPCFAAYTYYLFPGDLPKKLIRMVWAAGIALSVFVLATPARIYSYSMPMYQLFSILVLIYGLWFTITLCRKKRNNAVIFASGFLILFISALNDTLYTRQFIDTRHIISTGLLFFILIQTLILAKKFSSAFGLVENQKRRLEAEIGQRIRSQKRLEENEKKYKELVRYAPAGIYEFDIKELKFTSVNDVMCEYTGYSETEFLALDPYAIICEESRQTLTELVDDIYANHPEQRSVEYKIKGKNGKEFWVLANARFFYEANTPIKAMSVVHDLTKIRKAQDDRARLEKELQQARKMEAIGTLAGGIAHDFNNILSGIFGYSQLAFQRVDNPEKVRAYIEQIDKGAQRAAGLVRQILTFSRQEVYEKHPVKIAYAIKEALQLLRSSIPSSIDIHEKIVSKSTILADSTKIHQLIINLCTNAYHAIGKNTGRITISLTDKTVNKPEVKHTISIPPGHYIELEVSDTGSGMDASTLEKMFDPYFTTKQMGRGTGLGLSLVNAIVKEHQGFITVNSVFGKGTRFFVYFPVFREKTRQLSLASAETESLPGDGRILLVDDEKAIRDTFKEILEGHGYDVRIFKNGVEAVADLKQDPYQYDLVITDMTMPKMSGDTLAVEIRKMNPDIPVLLCTGFNEMLSGETASAIGITKILNKPLTMHDLLKNTREALEKRYKPTQSLKKNITL